MNHEEWRPVPGFERFYDVSDHGRVRSWHSGAATLMKPQIGTHGYPQYGLSVGGRQIVRTAHLLVALAFIGPRPTGAQVRHLDGNPLNPALVNLVYGDPRANSEDRIEHGTMYREPRTTCRRGHSLEDAYVSVRESRVPGRTKTVRLCRTCVSLNNRRAYLRRKATT